MNLDTTESLRRTFRPSATSVRFPTEVGTMCPPSLCGAPANGSHAPVSTTVEIGIPPYGTGE